MQASEKEQRRHLEQMKKAAFNFLSNGPQVQRSLSGSAWPAHLGVTAAVTVGTLAQLSTTLRIHVLHFCVKQCFPNYSSGRYTTFHSSCVCSAIYSFTD